MEGALFQLFDRRNGLNDPNRCPQCSSFLEPGVRFCSTCGSDLTGAPVAASAPPVGSQTTAQTGPYL
jgi:predicted amidophosphoribosyltransferase